MGNDVVLAHLEAPALYGRDTHAAAERLFGARRLGAAPGSRFEDLVAQRDDFRLAQPSALSRSCRTSAVLSASILSLVQAAERPGRTSLIVNIAFPS